MLNINSIEYSFHSEFHMLRHFENIGIAPQEKLLSHGYTISQIQQELSLTGSKFFSHFANDIKELVEKILEQPHQKTQGINSNYIFATEFSISEFPKGIGTKAVVSFDEISIELQSQIFFEKNRDYPLAHLLVEELPITNHCTLILKPIPEGYVFISAFPGESAMPIPDLKMEKEIFESCKRYWDGHVFLKKTRK